MWRESEDNAVIDYGLDGRFNSRLDCSISPPPRNRCDAQVASYPVDAVISLSLSP
jgi:hypothetical protein